MNQINDYKGEVTVRNTSDPVASQYNNSQSFYLNVHDCFVFDMELSVLTRSNLVAPISSTVRYDLLSMIPHIITPIRLPGRITSYFNRIITFERVFSHSLQEGFDFCWNGSETIGV